MNCALWPIALRADLVRAFRPGESPTREGPFRTLRLHHWAASGVPVQLRQGGHAAGRVVLFSMLNVEAAMSARCGEDGMAAALAKSAEKYRTEQGVLAAASAPLGASRNDGSVVRRRGAGGGAA